MAISNPLYMENPDLPEVDGRPAYQILPDAPGVQIVQEARGWVVKDLPDELNPDSINTGLTVTAPPADVSPAPELEDEDTDPPLEDADVEGGQSPEGDDK